MQQILNGKIYNTATMDVLAERDRYFNGKYSGSDRLCRTKNGALCMYRTSNRRDPSRAEGVEAVNVADLGEILNTWKLSPESAEKLAEFLPEA